MRKISAVLPEICAWTLIQKAGISDQWQALETPCELGERFVVVLLLHSRHSSSQMVYPLLSVCILSCKRKSLELTCGGRFCCGWAGINIFNNQVWFNLWWMAWTASVCFAVNEPSRTWRVRCDFWKVRSQISPQACQWPHHVFLFIPGSSVVRIVILAYIGACCRLTKMHRRDLSSRTKL
jgi:hypothetical protein